MVSSIITTYKRNSCIVERAICSILNQTYYVSEIIVVDDNDDNSEYNLQIRQLCLKYDRVTYIKQQGNKGACAARNLGIKNANGDYVAFLDDDDEWLPNKIELQMKAFREANKDVGMVYCCGMLKDEVTGRTCDYFNINTFKSIIQFSDLLMCDYIGSTSQPLIRKECFIKVGGFDENQPARQDYEMWLRIGSKYNIVGIKEKLFIHNLHNGEQISKSTEKAHKGYLNIYRKYFTEYRNYPEAEIVILHNIIHTRTNFSLTIIYYIFRRYLIHFKVRRV